MSATAGGDVLDRISLGFACLLLVASTGLGAAAASLSSTLATPEFVGQFTTAATRERFVLFPLGVATSIATFIALLRHGHLRSRRTRLQLLAVVLLFFSGALANGPIADASEALIAASEESSGALQPHFDRWVLWRWISFGLVVVTATALGVAHRQPAEVIDESHGLTSRHRSLLFLLGAATLFEGYDRFIASLALPYIGADLGATESTLGYALSAIRMGALASVPLGRVADRHGRRNLLLFTILAYTVATAATGFSTGIVTFVVFQFLATIFLLTELSLAQVVIAEEFPREFRARGQAFLGAFGALGAGLAAVIFPLFQQTTVGWRGLYFVGLLPLVLIAWLRRALPETERWQQARDEGRTQRAGLRDLLGPKYRVRFLALSAMAAALSATAAPAFGFASFRATRTFGWSPEQVSGLILVGGGLGFSGWFVFGVLAERIGRRPVCVITSFIGALAIAAYYQTSWLLTAFTAIVFAEAGAQLAISTLATEVFPTETRSTAKTWVTSAAIVGAMIGLGVVGRAADAVGSAAMVITMLAAGPILVSPLVWILPEPRGRELEEMVAIPE